IARNIHKIGLFQKSSSGEVSPSSTPAQNAPKFGTLIPNRIFVGGIAANTNETELKNFFASYGKVKDSKIISDRAGVSKGYGFITFETPEDAEKIIEKEANNLVFKDRKLNIGKAIRKQVFVRSFVRSFVPSFSPVLFTNGIQYSYHNGLAIFQGQDGSQFPVAQPTPQYPAVMVPQPMYVTQPQYSTYQTQAATAVQQNWTTAAAAAAAAANQWRWTPQGPTPTIATTPASSYLYHQSIQPGLSPEQLMYAQPPPQAYQPSDLSEAALMDTEGSMEPILASSTQRTYVTEVAPAVTTAHPATQLISASAAASQSQHQPVPSSADIISAATISATPPIVPAAVATYLPYQNQQHTNKAYYSSKLHVSPRKPYSTPVTMQRKPVRSVTKMINGTPINVVQELTEIPTAEYHDHHLVQQGPLTPPPTPM
ncbi:uncharacterized protein LOC141911550, partial [Tubulanus polymorphus]|uniref:uncharacterized protein LOC141911550 n=1 Tax=Tubulanus polymorphus TaxID=672921 RepID=UPI003DA65F90